MITTKIIGRRLKLARQKARMSAREVAEARNVTERTVHRWETGESLSMNSYLALCELYGVTAYTPLMLVEPMLNEEQEAALALFLKTFVE